MPRIRCHYLDCIFIDDGYCGAGSIEVDPDVGCMSYKPSGSVLDDDLDGADEDGWEELGFGEEEEDDSWLDEENFS